MSDEVKAGDEGSREGRAPTDEERAEIYRQQLKQLHVVDLVRDMMVTLVTVGYEKLGLTEQTKELRDLGDARVAIEALRRLIEVVEGDDPEDASLRSTLAQMQLNFARVANTEVPPARPSRAPSEADSRPSVESDSEPAKTAEPPSAAGKPATKKAATKKATRKPPAKKPAAKTPAAKAAEAGKTPAKSSGKGAAARKPAPPKAAGDERG